MNDIAERYAVAWCSQNPASVASFFAEEGSLTVNDGLSAAGEAAIAEVAESLLMVFPDLIILFDGLESHEDQSIFHWTLVGTPTGPAGRGSKVRISGYESWKIDADGPIAESLGRYDAAKYQSLLAEEPRSG